MLSVQALQWRRQAAACRRILQAGMGRRGGSLHGCCGINVGGDVATPSYTTLASPSRLKADYQLQLRSRFSTDEVVVKDSVSAPKTTAAASPLLSTTSQSDQPTPQPIRVDDDAVQLARKNAIDKSLAELQGAHELFHQLHSEAQALLHINHATTSSDEVVAMADFFLVLVNSVELEKYLQIVQSLQEDRALQKLLQKGEQHQTGCSEEEHALNEKLHQAAKSMSQLHHVFLKMVENCLPQNYKYNGGDLPSFNNELHSARTVGRALQLSRRAEELGMQMHRPLYQRLAAGIVLTLPSDLNDDIADGAKTRLVYPGQLQAIKEGTHIPPLALELLNVFRHARAALKVGSQTQLQQLAEDVLAEPFLMLLMKKQYEECMGLLRGGWSHMAFGGDIDLICFLGEEKTLDALEIAKTWLNGSDFAEDVKTNSHAIELTALLEVSLAEITKQRKQRAEKVSELLWQLSLASDDEDDDFEAESDSDFVADSDSDFEDDFDYGSDEEDLDTPTPTDMSSAGKTQPQYYASNNPNTENAQTNDHGESTIIMGMSDKEARKSIYLRNGVDWELPDIVAQLTDWNKGDQLTFTPEFERYLGQEIMKEEKEEE